MMTSMLELEITVLSCEGLNLMTQSSSFSSWCSSFILRSPANSNPTTHFISVTTFPDQKPKVYSGSLQDDGAGEGGVVRVPVDSSFLSDTQSCLYVQIYRKRRILWPSQVGWCLIPASDIGSPPPPSSVRCLSYRLRGRDGCVGGAIINLSIQWKDNCDAASAPLAIGIPIGTMEEGHIKSGR